MHVLLLEDDKKINDMLALYLRQENHRVRAFSHAETALEALEKETFEVVLSDLMLPGMQGETFVRRVREASDIHIVVITAKHDDATKLDLLKHGIDDVIIKPFSIDEVLYKLRNVERRIEREATVRFRLGEAVFSVKAQTNRIERNGDPLELNPTEMRILRMFLDHPTQVFSRDQIITACLRESDAFDRIVDTYVKNLRRKIGDKHIIETVYGEGYRFGGEHDA